MELAQSAQKSKFAAKHGTEITFDVIPCHLFNLPNELLAELAAWLSHPVDLLSLALTSKHLYERLTGPQASLLWRRTRAVFQPEPVPDPPGDLTEIAWAQFLFGLNHCGGCGHKTYDLPFSFALRLHLCKTCAVPEKASKSGLFSTVHSLVTETRALLGSHNASIDGPDNRILHDFVYSATPRLERQRSQAFWPSIGYPVLFQDLMEHGIKAWRFVIEALGQTADPAATLIETTKKLALRKRCGVENDQAAEKLLDWSMWLQGVLDTNEKHIVAGAKVWAKEKCVEYEDLVRSQAFRELWAITKRRRLSSMVSLLTEHHDKLLIQTTPIHRSRMQAAQSLALSKRQQATEQYYRNRIATQEYCPSFRVFRSLPVVKSLIQNIAGDDIRRDLKTDAIRSLIDADVKTWIDHSAKGVRRLLHDGSEQWEQNATLLWDEHSGKTIVAPEKRCNSLFVCQVCGNVEGPYKRAGVLDFKGLCLHECKEKHKSRKERTEWTIANFKLSCKAQEVVKMMLEMENLDVEDTPSSFLFDPAQKKERRWTCGNCVVAPMNRQDLVRHCQRHEDQKISLLRQDESPTTYQKRPFSFAELASGKCPDEARRKQFECVHCYKTGTHAMRRTVLDFNGLRCHLKSKHGILDVRNEDFGFIQT